MIIEHENDRITGIRGDPDHPANFGRLCSKGSTLHLTQASQTRVLRAAFPEMRREKSAPRQRVSWETALDHAAEKFASAIRQHGPDAVAFYISGQLLTEDYYVFNKLAKGLVGTNNIDTNSRLCMSSAVSGYKLTLGADAPPCAYEDIDHADCLFISGSNTAFAHPIVFRRIEEAKKSNPELKIIVVDPRRTDTAEAADLHLAITPGTDVALCNAMLHVLLWEDLCDKDFIRDHTDGFDVLRDAVRDFTPAVAAGICGVKAEDIVTAAQWFGRRGGNTLSMWCQGLNQSTQGSHNNAALVQLHLATGKIGKTGCGPFSLTGQPNAMGGREVGGMANLLSAHRDMANPQHRAEVAALWQIDRVPETPGLTAVELFDAVHAGKIKALWIACTNPAQSMPNADKVREALARCEFVVVQEAYTNTDTTAYADLLLPAASWGEKEGTATNSERRITHVNAAVSPPGEARDDWKIAVDFARAFGAKTGQRDLAQRLFPYSNSEEVFNEHRESTRGRDLDISGLSYSLLDAQGPQQWPFPLGASSGCRRLYEDGVFPTATGRARFVVTRPQPVAEQADARFPIQLTTGRLRDQWHGMSRTGTVARLFNHAAEPTLDLNPQDVDRRGLAAGDMVKVSSRRGSFIARVNATPSIRSGQAFMPMHWGGQFMSGAGTNAVTVPAFDPISKQPELKHAAIKVEKFSFAWQLVALRRAPIGMGEETLKRHGQMQSWMARFAHATLTLAGRDEPVLVLRAWGDQLLPDELDELDAALGLGDDQQVLMFADKRRGISKRALIADDRLLGVRLAGETRAADWLKEVMTVGEIAPELRRWLLAPVTQPPAGSKSRGRIICNCHDVAESEVVNDLAAGCSLGEVQDKRKCGTSCGSCVPELKRLAATAVAAA